MRQKIASIIFFIGLIGFAGSIPVSKFTTSVGQFLFAIGWLVGFSTTGFLQRWKENKKIIIPAISIFLIFVIGLWNSSNLEYGLKDLKIKLPLLLLPFLLGTGPQINKTQILVILSFFSASAITAAAIGWFSAYGFSTPTILSDFRQLSPFISLIRLSLSLVFAIGFCIYLLVKSNSKYKWLLTIPMAFTVCFLLTAQSLTGLVLLPIVVVLSAIFLLKDKSRIKKTIAFCLAVLMAVTAVKVYNIGALVLQKKEVVQKRKTLNGNNYNSINNVNQYENGWAVSHNICRKELFSAWNKRSSISHQTEENGYPLSDVIIRFLTSKGLSKDSLGISLLSQQEISAIENRVPNVFLMNASPIERRIHQTFWEIDRAINGNYYEETSIAQRYIYVKTGLTIFKNHFWLGTGTGDVKDAFIHQYNADNIHFKQVKRTHNQFVTIGLSLGILGLLIFVALLIIIWTRYEGSLRFLFIISQSILLISFLWEDTLESQAGVSIFAVLTYLYLFENQQPNPKADKYRSA